MAEALVVLERRRSVTGHLREVAAVSVAFAATGDTWTVPGIRRIEQINLQPSATGPIPWSWNINGNQIALNATAAMTFRGAVVGI